MSATTLYHPQSNGMVERFHRTLKNALWCTVQHAQVNCGGDRCLGYFWAFAMHQKLRRQHQQPRSSSVPLSTCRACVSSRNSGVCARRKSSCNRQGIMWQNFCTETLDLRRFKSSPFIAKALRTAAYVFVREDRLGKPALAPKYTGPFRVLQKDWDSSTFRLDFGNREDLVSHCGSCIVSRQD